MATYNDFVGGATPQTDPNAVQKPNDPDDAPNPLNPGGISNNELRRRQQTLQTQANQTATTNIPYAADRTAANANTLQQSNQLAYQDQLNAAKNGISFTDKLIPSAVSIGFGAVNPALGIAANQLANRGLYDPINQQNATFLAQQNQNNPAYNPVPGSDAARAQAGQSPAGTSTPIAGGALSPTDQLRQQLAQQQTATGTEGFNPTGQFDVKPTIPLDQRNINRPGANGAVPDALNISGNQLAQNANALPSVAPIYAPTQPQTKVGQAAQQARDALGPAPQIDMGIADRNNQAYQDSLAMNREVLNRALAPAQGQADVSQAQTDNRALLAQLISPNSSDAEVQAGLGMSKDMLNRLLNSPSIADRLGSQTLRTQLALAKGASGGPGAVQAALRDAAFQAPELQAQATQQAIQEQDLRNQAAAGVIANRNQAANALVANQNTRLATAADVGRGLAQQAGTNVSNENQRLATAGNVASNFTQGALGGKQQDIEIAKSNQSAATALLDDVTRTTGTQLELDQRNQELLGQMARDAASTGFKYAELDQQAQEAEWDRAVKVYGIDQAAAASIKAAAIANHKSVWDYVVGFAGPVATVGATALANRGGGSSGGGDSSDAGSVTDTGIDAEAATE